MGMFETTAIIVAIAVLSVLSVAQSAKLAEKAKGDKARNIMNMVTKAEAMYYAQNSAYTADPAELSDFVELSVLDNDNDWEYLLLAPRHFSINAKRKSGPCKDAALILASSRDKSVEWVEAEWPPKSGCRW